MTNKIENTLVVAGAVIAPYVSGPDATTLLEKAAPLRIGEPDLLPVLQACGAKNTYRAVEIVEHSHFSNEQGRKSLMVIARLTSSVQTTDLDDLPALNVEQLEKASKLGPIDTGTEMRDYPMHIIFDLVEAFNGSGFDLEKVENPAFIEFLDMDFDGKATRAYASLLESSDEFGQKVRAFLEEYHPNHLLSQEDSEDAMSLEEVLSDEKAREGDLSEEENF
jgi:hypothetical protein